MELGKYNLKVELLKILGITGIVAYHIACFINIDSGLIGIFKLISIRQWVWVDVFFALSGYYFYQAFTGRFENKCVKYLKNRAIRIIPAYYLFLIFYLTIGLKIERSAGYDFILPSQYYWIHFFTFTVNIPIAFGNWTGVALEGFFMISALVQFYIIFASLYSVIKNKKYRVLIILLFQILSIYLRNLELFQRDEWISYFFTFTRIDAFLWGMLLNISFKNNKVKSLLYKNRVVIFILSLIVSLMVIFKTGFLDYHNINTLRLALPFIILSIVAMLNIVLNRESKTYAFYSGDYVYGIYLTKLPLIYLVLSYVESLSLKNSISSYLFILLSLAICILWGLIFHMTNQLIKKRGYKFSKYFFQ